ncbi:M23 family metallopeptidase [Pseudomonas sp. NBRC 111135]|uniref:M23 family metallopeptidase n=1 Tax=Pseudomonas sp. NBRC 111135 TaxID=1661050 RepID=UPI0006D3F220|nr:M23 family metallopeptidase [Pseudomonas sp. NBRC 111135]
MIISPPFIPAPIAGETDEAFVERAMPGGEVGDGAYPLSFDLNWHGGMHLRAPQENGRPLPIRAIADGTLAYFRAPTTRSDDPEHALNYGDGWTDNGCVVLRHETEIGEGERGQVVFFSIYMHLSKINIPHPQLNQRIYRKDSIGEAGQIYGSVGKVHFEIIADDSQITHLTGRNQRDLDYQNQNGRTDSCWGDMYFFLPNTLLGYASPPTNLAQPNSSSDVAYRSPQLTGGWSSENGFAGSEGYSPTVAEQLSQGLIVRMTYDRGQCRLTTYCVNGEQIGIQQEEADFEYNLYTTATRRYPGCPSAGYELLRFGRVLGPDALQPANAAHWRKICLLPRTEAGETERSAWFNLNASGVTRFSDADFPHWMGWRLINDDSNEDSHCQSDYIRSLLEPPSYLSDPPPRQPDAATIATSPEYDSMYDGDRRRLSEQNMDERELNTTRLKEPENQGKLKRVICKFPTEWAREDFEIRYRWLKRVADHGSMSEDDFKELERHHQAMAFWEEAGLEGIESKHWHFPPRETIASLKTCTWLSRSEMLQTLPANSLRKSAQQWIWESITLSGAEGLLSSSNETAKSRRIELNKSLRKFLVADKVRLACLFGNATQETQWYQKFHEASSYWYAPWDGRGLLQLTHASNYLEYWKFQGRPIDNATKSILELHTTQANNNRPIIQGQKSMNDPTHSLSDTSTGISSEIISRRNNTKNAYEAAHSAGAYWAWSKSAMQADSYLTDSSSTLKTVQTTQETSDTTKIWLSAR